MATMTAAQIDALPDSDFAYIEPGGKVVGGRTEPRSLRHFPINDEAHVRNALARLSSSPFGERARARVEAAARRMGIGAEGKGALAGDHAARGADLLSGLYQLIGDEAGEDDQVAVLQRGADALAEWIGMESAEPDASPDEAQLADVPVAGKARELKAEDMTASRLDRWLKGEIPRRILVIPFGGPIPMKGAPLGVDLDGEWFDADTDLYGPYPALRASRERLVDWHHTTFADRVDPAGGRMKGAILGKVVLDADPSDDGLWADFWANAGEERRRLVAQLERRGVPLYGSSQPVQAGVVKGALGHIDAWPVKYHTISTSPQNTWAAVPPLKALLTADDIDGIGWAAVKAALLGLADSAADLRPTSRGGAASTFSDAAASGTATPAVLPYQIVQAGVAAAIRRLAAMQENPT